MATRAAPPQKRSRRAWRIARWPLAIVLLLIVALLAFALMRPLTTLVMATQVRLWFDGIHSESTQIPFAGAKHVLIHYYVGGSGTKGPPVVLVHGLGGRAEDWANMMPQLVRDGHRVYALDLPGYGRSAWPRNATYSIREEAEAVEAFMDTLHLTRVDLGGWSMGGWIALQMALNQPQPIRRLMIFDSAGLRWNVTWNTDLFEPNTPAKLRQLDNLLMPGPAPHVPGFIQHAIFRFVARHGWVVRRNMDSMLTGADLLDGKLGALTMPMLIVWGKQDHLIPVSVGEEIHHDVPQSELDIFDGCGHLAAGYCAGRVGPVVKGFLDEASPMPGREAEIPR
jgi:pimeloyl-ACP methyl ester carboxylesterase